MDALASGIPALRTDQGRFTAVVSIATAVMLVNSIPQALALTPESPTQLRTADLKLENEIAPSNFASRRRYGEAHVELDEVQERTVQLANANEELLKEMRRLAACAGGRADRAERACTRHARDLDE